jgi:hypothetical protein
MAIDAKLARGAFLRRAGLGVGAVAVAGAVPSVALAEHITPIEVEGLNLLLRVNRLEFAFYSDAVTKAKLKGDLVVIARVARLQERAHVRLLTRLLGADAEPAQRYDFKTATSSDKEFGPAARELEDLAAQAAIAQLARLVNRRSATQVAEMLAVDARHSAWLRTLIGGIGNDAPAPNALEVSRGNASVQRGLNELGFITA